MSPAFAAARPRSTYRHGDLQWALLAAGVQLARAGGPAAVVLREATRRAGVAPNAAYRHYASREELLDAVRAAALVTCAQAMRKELAKAKPAASAVDRARVHLRAVGLGYLDFARAEPGLFRTAFSMPGAAAQRLAEDAVPEALHPFALLGAALDELVDAGLLPRERRAGAEYVAWSAVHGLAMLVLDGPLAPFSRSRMRAVAQRVLEMVERGLS